MGVVDYVGIWNERTWGNADWVVQLRAALDASGFGATKIILPDGGWGEAARALAAIDADPNGAFEAALSGGGGIGLHYPCNDPQPQVQLKYGLKYWSSEDYSTVANWAGAACWGRILNQNAIRMNMTSTIAWSLIWSVFPDWPYFGNGLMYAMQPWAGHYEVNAAVWTSAHHTQFLEPGWVYVAGEGRGMLPGGGSYVASVSPPAGGGSGSGNAAAGVGDLTIVVEKLEGRCLRCAGQATATETVAFRLAGGLAAAHASLAVWRTNETSHFARDAADAAVDPATGVVTVTVARDSIVTLSSLRGQRKGGFPGSPIPAAAPFPPPPYADDFEGGRGPPGVARYFSDNGGSFELRADPLAAAASTGTGSGSTNTVLAQAVDRAPTKNAWTPNVEPITVLGANTTAWSDGLAVAADVLVLALPPPPFGPAPPPGAPFENLCNAGNGLCLDVNGKSARAGALVDTWACVPDYNEQWRLVAATGLLQVLGPSAAAPSGMCLSAGPCDAGAAVCQAPCDADAANQTWARAPRVGAAAAAGGGGGGGGGVEHADLRLAGTSTCAEVQPDNKVAMAPCDAGVLAQGWTAVRDAASGKPHAGVCVHVVGGGGGQRRGHCLRVHADDNTWAITENGAVLAGGALPHAVLGGWATVALVVTDGGRALAASVNGTHVGNATASGAVPVVGRAALISGWNVAYFDSFEVSVVK